MYIVVCVSRTARKGHYNTQQAIDVSMLAKPEHTV